MISKTVLIKMEDKGDGGLYMTLVITRHSLRTINPCNHDYPSMGRGLACSLFILVREPHNYIRVRGTPESGLLQVYGQ
jgi:hypothetical protein